MMYTDKICPYCKSQFKEDDEVVICSICEMPHHKSCWVENQGCTTFGCTGTIVGADQYEQTLSSGKLCNKCGARAGEEQKFCAMCGAMFPQEQAAQSAPYQQPGYYQPQPQQNYYQQPQPNYYQQPAGGYQPYQQILQGSNYYGEPANGYDEDVLRFVQENRDVYARKFNKMLQKGSKVSWNWCGFLFSLFWMSYRKMYKYALAYAGIFLVIGLLGAFSYAFPLAGLFTSGLGLALCVCSGLFTDYLYFHHIHQQLKKAAQFDERYKTNYIMGKGGTSGAALAISLAVYLVIYLIIYGIIDAMYWYW